MRAERSRHDALSGVGTAAGPHQHPTPVGQTAAGPPARLLTVKEAAALMRVRPGTVYAWVAAGRLPALRAGSRIRFRYDDLLAWLGDREGRRFECPGSRGM